MAQPSCEPITNSVWVIGPQFCTPHAIELTVDRKVMSISDGKFSVTDAQGNFMFKVKGSYLKIRDQRVLIDAAGHHIVTLRQKMLTAHSRWEVYRGDSSNPKDLLFSVRTSRAIQLKTKLDVFLANNRAEDICDFKVDGSWLERSCAIYAGESSIVVAQMHKKHSVESVLLGKDKFMVTVYPNIDYAFVVALIVILDEINN